MSELNLHPEAEAVIRKLFNNYTKSDHAMGLAKGVSKIETQDELRAAHFARKELLFSMLRQFGSEQARTENDFPDSVKKLSGTAVDVGDWKFFRELADVMEKYKDINYLLVRSPRLDGPGDNRLDEFGVSSGEFLFALFRAKAHPKTRSETL